MQLLEVISVILIAIIAITNVTITTITNAIIVIIRITIFRLHYGPEATPTKKKVPEDPKVVLIRIRPPLSPKKFQNRAIRGFEKKYVLYVAMAEKPLSSGQKWFLR